MIFFAIGVTLCTFVAAIIFRTLYIILFGNGFIPKENSRRNPARILVVLGSGGHTTEILQVVSGLKPDRYSPRIYVRASTDVISASKVRALEGEAKDYKLLDIRRSREVHQPYFASVWTTILATIDSFPIIWNQRPDLVLCNGPGTCVPLCFVAFIYKVLLFRDIKIVFIESYCRVKTLSLTGKILYNFADFVIVRWKSLKNSMYPRNIYLKNQTSMDVFTFDAEDLIPSESLLNDIKTNSPPEIGIHLAKISQDLWNYINSKNIPSYKWIESRIVLVEACLDRTWESLNSGNWKDVSINYRYCYSFCVILKSALLLLRLRTDEAKQKPEITDVETLKDMVLEIDKGILLGAPPLSVPTLLPTVARKLSSIIIEIKGKKCWNAGSTTRLGSGVVRKDSLPGFDLIIRRQRPSMESFYTSIFKSKTPAVLEGCMGHWKALDLWSDPEYLLRTAGIRTVPIEIGSRYTDEDWTQRLVSFSEFLESYVLSDNGSSGVGYLAQHGLFDQIPELMEDISVPDYCSFSDNDEEAAPPVINAWLGPAGTVSPLHFDPKNNLLCQVFGTKRVILYHPDQTPNLYPYETRLLSNTARVDPVKPDFEAWPKFEKAIGSTCVLKPGEMLFIPPGWWHHVVSASPSFSVSFWWD